MVGQVVEQILDTYKALPIAVIFMIFGSMLYQLMVYYCSIAIGHTFTGNKIAGSIIGYVILYVITEVVMLVGVFAIGLIVGIDDINAYANSADGMPVLFGVTGVIMAVFAGIVFYITNRIFTKKLNLN
jgi:protein-S-isoprenylcysteine O-methyltransferase Ste14